MWTASRLVCLPMPLLLVAVLGGCGGGREGSVAVSRSVVGAEAVSPAAATPVAQAVIGPAGGALSYTGFRLTVPSGAFSGTYTLKLLRQVRPPGAEAGCVSHTYTVAGLPTTLNAALSVSITPLSGETISGYSFIAVGETAWASGEGPVKSLRPCTAKTVSGRLVAVLPATGAMGDGVPDPEITTRQAATGSVSLSAFTGWRALLSAARHFRVVFHPGSCPEAAATRLARSAETAWNIIGTTYRMSWARRTALPIDLEVHAIGDPDIAARQVGSVWGVNYAYVEVDSARVGSEAEAATLSPVIQHEIFHLAQDLYDPRNRYAVAKTPSPWYWFQEATATFFEYTRNAELVTPPAPYPLPYVLDPQGCYDAVARHSLEYRPGDPILVRRHGYSHAQFVASLVASIGEQGIGQVFARQYANPALSPVGALVDQMGTTVDLERQFLSHVRDWVTGSLFRGHRFPTANQVRMTATRRLTVGGTHLLARAEGSVGDLSILPLLIAREGTPPPGTRLLIGVRGLPAVDREVLLYRCQGINFVELGTSWPLEIADFEDAANYLLVVANVSVTTPYTSSQEVSVGVQVKPEFSSVTPASGPPGTTVVIQGYGFGAAQGNASLTLTSSMDTTPVTPATWSNTRVEFVLPDTHQYNLDYTIGLRVPGPAAPDWIAEDTFVFHMTAP